MDSNFNCHVISEEEYDLIFHLMRKFNYDKPKHFEIFNIHFNKDNTVDHLLEYFLGQQKQLNIPWNKRYDCSQTCALWFLNSQEECDIVQQQLGQVIETLQKRSNSIKQITFDVCQKYAFNEANHCGNF